MNKLNWIESTSTLFTWKCCGFLIKTWLKPRLFGYVQCSWLKADAGISVSSYARPERLFFSQTPSSSGSHLNTRMVYAKRCILPIETSIFPLFHPFILVESPSLRFHSPPASLPDRSQKFTGKRHAVTRCISQKINKKKKHATMSLPNLDSLRAIAFKEHFSGAPSPAQLVSMANGNLISSERGQQA